MTIHVPQEIENAINAAVQRGLFASPDDAIAEAWHYFERQRIAAKTPHARPSLDSDPLLGFASDHVELMDQIVEEAMQRRERQAAVDQSNPLSEAEFKQRLLALGLMSSLPIPSDATTRPAFQPVTIEGEPLSDTIIRERR